jgi:hypothetical protein
MAVKRKKCRAEVRKILSVYAGREMLGVIEEGKTCLARDVDGNRVGTFTNRKAALDAFFSRKQPTSDAGTLIVEG